MSDDMTLWDRLEKAIDVLSVAGHKSDAVNLQEALESSGTSLELYFKCSGVIGNALRNKEDYDESDLYFLNSIKSELDSYIG